MIRAGAQVAINSSGGKGSQAMTILLSGIVSRDQLLVAHALLGEVEWPGTVENIESTLPRPRATDLRAGFVRQVAARPDRGARQVPRNPAEMVHGVQQTRPHRARAAPLPEKRIHVSAGGAADAEAVDERRERRLQLHSARADQWIVFRRKLSRENLLAFIDFDAVKYLR